MKHNVSSVKLFLLFASAVLFAGAVAIVNFSVNDAIDTRLLEADIYDHSKAEGYRQLVTAQVLKRNIWPLTFLGLWAALWIRGVFRLINVSR